MKITGTNQLTQQYVANKTKVLKSTNNSQVANNTFNNPEVSFIESMSESQSATKNTTSALNTSLRWFDDSSVIFSQMQSLANGKMFVPIGKNELLGLMDKIEEALAKGEDYTTALQAQYDSHNFQPSTRTLYDSFLLDPNTGEITFALPLWASIGENGYNHSQHDDDVVWDLAYDLQKFIQLRVFGETNGMSEDEAERMIAEIKERQINKCTDRFDKHGDWDGRIYGRDGGEIPNFSNSSSFLKNRKPPEEVTPQKCICQDNTDTAKSEIMLDFIDSIGKHQEFYDTELHRLGMSNRIIHYYDIVEGKYNIKNN